jgi:hypothetical protein
VGQSPKGEDKMGELKIGQAFKVVASSGLNLRKEPTTSADIILLMREGEHVRLVADEVRESDGYHWYNVIYEDAVGWAASEYLELVPVVVAETPPPGLNPEIYRFWFDPFNRTISVVNLQNAINNQKITSAKITETQTQITLDKAYNNTRTYWVSRNDLKGVQISPPINTF